MRPEQDRRAAGASSGITARRIEAGGIGLDVSEAGAGGRPLLLVHGFTGNRIDFDTVLLPLAALGWHVVAPDLRGHGTSDHPSGEDRYSLDLFARDLIALVDALGWDELVLLGHSMGGMVAQLMVLEMPDRVRALVLMDTSARGVAIDPELVELGAKIARENGLATVVELQREIEDPLGNPAHERMCATVPGYRERSENNTLISSPDMYASMLHQITADQDRLPALAAGVTCPTLVLVGELDAAFRDASQDLADAIAGAELTIVETGGHSPQLEATDQWLAAMERFLSTLA
jgi:pimeloyl-ACP methyl ester carboxylesterase